MMKGPKGKPEERLRLLSLSSPEETEGRPQCSYNFLMGKRRGAGTDLLTLLTGDRIQGNGWKLCQGQFRLGIRKRFFPQRVVGTGTGSPRAPSLTEFKKHLDSALRPMV